MAVLPKRKPKTTHSSLALYDADLLEEESIVQWYEEGLSGVNKSSKIWKNVKPLVEWLQSAETESEEE